METFPLRRQREQPAYLESRVSSIVRAIVQPGTYNCRRMAAYPDLVSEHSFANAVDIARFQLKKGPDVVVERYRNLSGRAVSK